MPILSRAGQPDIHYALDDFTDPWTNAPYLILQHGYCRNADFWYQWVPHLARFYKVVRPDMRGLGRSGRNFDLASELDAAAYVGDLRALIAHLGDAPVHYCGESFGGHLGMVFGGMYPDLFRSLTLIAAPVHINEGTRKSYACGHASWPEAIRRMGVRAWLAQTNRSARFPPDMPQAFVDWYDQGVASAGADMMVRVAEIALAANALPWLSKITAPVLNLHPSGGVIASDEQRAILAREVRDIRFVALPTPYHMIQYIRPGLCARQVLQFAAAVDGRICEE
ncbi:MAG: alpha/beta fold hydrolase [Burkholderiales bacterium]